MIRVAAVIVFILTPLVFAGREIGAQDLEPSVVHAYSIDAGEEDALFFPSFVWSDHATGEVYVIDGRSRIIIYTSDFFPLLTLDDRDGVESPQGLTVDGEGNLYVAQAATRERARPRITVFNACLTRVRDIYLEGFEGAADFSPYRLAVAGDGRMYVAGFYFPGVLVLNSEGRLIGILSPEEKGKKVKLNDVSLDGSGRVYMVSEETGHVYVYDREGRLLFRFGQKGGSTGKLSRPMAAAVDDGRGRIYVVDYMRHTVSVYDLEGEYLFEFGGLGLSEGWFQYPRHLTVDREGRILVADTFNNRVEVYRAR